MKDVKIIQQINTLALACLFALAPYFCHGIELKTAYQDSPPKFYLNDSGEMVGLGVDIMKAMVKTEPNLSFKSILGNSFLPSKRVQVYLEEGTLDIFFGYVKNLKRLKRFNFLDIPIYPLKHVVAVRANDKVVVNSFDDIRNLGMKGIILSVSGGASRHYLDNQGGLIIDTGGITHKGNLYKLTGNRGRFVYSHNLGLVALIKQESLHNKIKILPTSFRDYFHFVAISKALPKETVKLLNETLHKLSNSGELTKILKKYTEI